MDLNEVARIFNDSYERVMNATGNPEAFFTEFYKLPIATSPEAAVKFRDTDMKQQVRMLRGSVALLLSFYATGDQDGYLSKLAERHSKQGKDIPPQMYSVWLDCLIETARQIDPGFNEDVSAAWRAVFSKGIAFMVAKYEKRDDMTSPQSQLEQLDKLVRDMLVIPRSENGECVVQKVPCMLDRLVPEAVQSASIFARTKWIRIETGEMPESPIEADPNLIRQMLLIVLYNAVEYSPCGSTVAVMLNFNSDYYEVLVLDEGGTIIRSEREWVFRDDQTDARRSHESGSYRLGLPTAKSIANVHGGFLDLVGSDTEGSTFRIRLPKPSVDLKH
jgi:signal transduction histidine kinase